MAARGRTGSASTWIVVLALLLSGLSLVPAGATPPPGSDETKLFASDGADSDIFGRSLASHGDAIVVGAPYDDDHGTASGAVYVYTPDGAGGYTELKLTASDAESSASFGWAVAAEGNTIVAGAPGAGGAVYVFTETGQGQYSELKLRGSTTAASFGQAVAIEGGTIVVGAAADADHGQLSGAVYVYTPDGLGGYGETKLTASDGEAQAYLGASVAIEGGTIVAGATNGASVAEGHGSVYLFTPDGLGGYDEVELMAADPTPENLFGASVAIDGGIIVVGAPDANDDRYPPGGSMVEGHRVGAVYLYQPDPTGGYVETKLVSSDSVQWEFFGRHVDIEGGQVAVGATGDDTMAPFAGAVYLYRPDGQGGYAETKVTASDGTELAEFGIVQMQGDQLLVGAFGADGNVPSAGAVYVYEPPRDPVSVLAVPCPLYDSTTATGVGLGGALAAGELRTVSVTGPVPVGQGVGTAQCVPAGATAAVVTISALDPQGSGNLRLSPAGVAPNGGVVNYAAGPLHNANTVTVPLSAAGEVDVFANAAATDVRLVAVGYTSAAPAAGLHYNGLTPCALADSRPNQGPTGAHLGPFGGGAAYPDIDVVGTFPAAQGGGNTDCGVPAGADAVLLNLVAVNATGGTGYLSAATGGLDPVEAVTPFADLGMNNAATTIVPLNGGETVAIDIDAVTGTPSVHVRAVVLGYYDEIGDGFTPLTGCAAFDSRPGFGGSGAFVGKRPGGSTTTYQITGTIPAAQGGNGGHCGVPPGTTAVLINLVAVQPDEDGNLRAYATGATPTGGVLNFASVTPALNNSNAVVVPLSPDGQIDVFTNTATNDGTPATHVRGVILGYLR